MSEAAPPARLIVGEDLRLLRLLLPPLGISLLLAAMIGFAVDALGALQAGTVAVLGLAMLLWIETVASTRLTFDPATRQICLEYLRGIRESRRMLHYEQVRDIVVRVIDGVHDDNAAPLGRLVSLELLLITDTGDVRLSHHIENTLRDCERQEARIWHALGRRPAAPLLLRSYRHARRGGDLLQGAWLGLLLEPGTSWHELEARYQEDRHAHEL